MTAKAEEMIGLFIKELDMMKDIIEEIANKEQERYDNYSERTQESEKGERLLENIEHLEEAVEMIDNASCALDELDYE